MLNIVGLVITGNSSMAVFPTVERDKLFWFLVRGSGEGEY